MFTPSYSIFHNTPHLLPQYFTSFVPLTSHEVSIMTTPRLLGVDGSFQGCFVCFPSRGIVATPEISSTDMEARPSQDGLWGNFLSPFMLVGI